MQSFINSSQNLIKKLQSLEKRYSKITVTPTKLTAQNLCITTQTFTNASFTISLKNLLELVEIQNFTIKNNHIYYAINNKIFKKIKVEEEIKVLNINLRKKIEIEPEIAFEIGKIRGIETVKVFYQDEVVHFYWNDGVEVDISFFCDEEFKEFYLRTRDLWFLNTLYDKVFMCLCEDCIIFYLYDYFGTSMIRVDIVD